MKGRAGIALVLAIAMLLLVEALAVGMLAMAMHARLVAAAQLRSARAEAAARFAASLVLANWESAAFDTLARGAVVGPPIGRGSEADVSWSATVERATASAFLLRTEGRTGGGEAYSVARSHSVARILDSQAVLRQFNAATISSGPLILAGRAAVSGIAELPPAWADSMCPSAAYLTEPAAVIAAAPPIVSETVEVIGAIVLDTSLAVGGLALGNLGWTDIDRIADTTVSEALDLSAWGNSYPLIASDGDLTITGSGEGILAVAGVLTVAAGAAFTGLIVARDGLTIGPGARIHGAVLSQGGYALIDGAAVTYSRCAIVRMVLLTPAANRPVFRRRRFIAAF